MKIRCKNCYRVLNENEEYCTSCGEYSERMHNAMVTGNFGPDNIGKFKIAFGIYAIAGFLICGILQVVFAVIQTKEIDMSTNLFCQTNSLFYSSIATILFSVIIFRKDLKEYVQIIELSKILASIVVAIFIVCIILLLSKLDIKFLQVWPSYIVDYLENKTPAFFDLKGECIFKILTGTILATVSLELVKKYLIDAFDDTLLDEKLIYLFATIIITVFEIAWFMSLEIAIIALIINLVTTGIYMLTNRNVVINIGLRFVLYIVTLLLLIL